ncbi:type II secretion system secretin GspD [Marinicella sp. S1101]|uniref:type II secretion system secretin GspD n=1 Tax=Marinicella marina TaxID=2996016 RepID=UPI0022608A52|nr:type II secretion system secretin GspD [Marinicella marina]MCX7552640.1 type II secretion system secretin GspD [Marinicella marina]MDJ1139516.1 type II secretion system secretin GspD [Marinicella marina]
MIKTINKRYLTVLFAVLATGCATQQKDLRKELDNSNYLEGVESIVYSGEVFNDGSVNATEREVAEYYPGTGEFINFDAASRTRTPMSEEGEVTFNFEGESLQAVVHFILGEVLKENYVIAPGVSGKVTFATAKPVSKKQIVPILEMMLSWNKAALVRVDDRYHVLPEGQAIKGLLTPRLSKNADGGGYQVLAVPLTYVSPTEMEKILEPYAKAGAVVKADNARNILFLSGTNSELTNYLDTIEIFDVDWLSGMSTGIFYLKQVESTDILTELEALFGEGADNPLAGMFRFLPLERLNAIMVITPQEDYLHQAKKWIDRLDRADSDGASNLYVYSVKNIKADDLAAYLNDVFGGTSGSSSSRKASGGSVVPGQTGKEVSSSGASNTNTNRRRTSNNSSGSGINDIFISAIEDSNQLLIKAGVVDYEKILSAIERLDIEPLQVLVELKIIEITLNDAVSYGMELLFGDEIATTPVVTPDPETKSWPYNFSTSGSTVGSGGISYRFLGTEAEARLDALESENRVAVLSSPSLLVLNNKNATINVGDQIPITNVGSVGSGNVNNGTISNTRYIQTGVQVDITPRVNPGGLVYMEVSQDVSTPGAPDANGQRPIASRQLNTEIAVQSGNTIVMGGLISENDGFNRSGVPGLSRIPFLGGVFGRKSKSTDRTELMLLITPTVIENPEQARQLTTEYAKKFRGLKPLNVKDDETNNENEND